MNNDRPRGPLRSSLQDQNPMSLASAPEQDARDLRIQHAISAPRRSTAIADTEFSDEEFGNPANSGGATDRSFGPHSPGNAKGPIDASNFSTGRARRPEGRQPAAPPVAFTGQQFSGEVRELKHYYFLRDLLQRGFGHTIGREVHDLADLVGLAYAWDLGVRETNDLDTHWFEWPLAAIGFAPGPPKGMIGSQVAQQIIKRAGPGKKAHETFAQFRRNYEADYADDLFDGATGRAEPVPQRPLPRAYSGDSGTTRVSSIVKDPKVVKGVHEAVRRGQALGGREWYDLSPLRDAFIEEFVDQFSRKYGAETGQKLGIEAGQREFTEFVDYLAATSPVSTIQDNIRIASYYAWKAKTGRPITHVDEVDRGYGSYAQKRHVEAAKEIASGGMNPFRNPKRASMRENLLGNEFPVTIDSNFMRLIGVLSENPALLRGQFTTRKGRTINPRAMYESGELTMEQAIANPQYWEVSPSAREYAELEQWVQKQAEQVGLSPAQFQASMFLGGAELTGLKSALEPALKTLTARINYTAWLHGMKPKDIFRSFLKGEIPLNSFVAGAAAGTAAAAAVPSRNAQQPEERPGGQRRPDV